MSPKIHQILFGILLALMALASPRQLLAQIPPHEPGTICFTPTMWCWAQTPGLPGRPCQCWNGSNWESGTLG